MATYICKKNKSSASTCTTEGSTTSSSPASSVNLVTTNSHIQQQPQHNSITNNNNNNAPKYGTLVPNRVFVGGISGSTTETELAQLFSAYGTVKATKVISDRAGVSKGYGFVTFETEEEAKRLMRDSECIVLKERKLNIAPAIKKQPFNRTYEAASPPTVHSNTAIMYQNGVPYTFHNGVAYFPATPPQHATAGPITTAADPAGVYQTTFGPPPAAPTHSPAATAYPVIYPCTAPPTMYMTPQQFQYQPMPPPAQTSQYIYTASTSSTSAAAPGTGPPATQGSPMMGAPAPLPPTQHYYTPAHLNPTDMYYSVAQPYPAMISNEGIMYETPPQTETSSNQSAEDSCSNSSNSDTVRSGGGGNYKPPPLNQEKMVAKRDRLSSNGGWTATNNQPPALSQRQNATTPVVSLLKLQQAGEELDAAHNNKKSSPPTIHDYLTTPPPQQSFYQQVPPPLLNSNKPQTPLMPVLYQSMPPMFLQPSGQSSGNSSYMNQYPPSAGMMNGHSDQSNNNYSGHFQNQRPPYPSKPYFGRRGGGHSGNHSSPMSVHIPPFPPKFHFMNNTHMPMSGNNQHQQGLGPKRHYNNRNQNNQYRGRDNGRYMGPSSNRTQRRFFGMHNNTSNMSRNSAPSNNVGATAEGSASLSTCTTSTTVSSAASTISTATTTTTTTTTSTTTANTITTTTNSTSPPPAPYSPMTHPVIIPSDSSSSVSPPQQVQFYSGGNSGTGRQNYYPPSNGSQQQLTVPPRRFINSSRKSSSGASNGSVPNNGSSRNNGGNNGKYSKGVINGVQVISTAGNPGAGKMMGSVDESSLGGAGDASTMMPPASCGGNISQGSVMQETCHQMQTLSL
ncbi:uncharacterized protein [Periplaneta americana]|uniref:uncharacterized protein isoform X2 n=1 Tax=Periplaneta americana TaxID=6978 RepID=UPI0037E855D0